MAEADDFSDAAFTAHQQHYDRANELCEESQWDEALAEFARALDLVPQPHFEREEATNTLAGIGDCWFAKGDLEKALDAFEQAKKCPEGIGNPFIHLRLGQIKHDLGRFDQAADELMRAYMAGAEEVFEGEDQKYFAFLKTRAQID